MRTGVALRLTGASLLLLFGGLATAAGQSIGAPPVGPGVSQDFIGEPLGIMQDGGPIIRKPGLLKKSVTCPQPAPDAACNMTYHSGSLVIGPHTTHVVYWEPAGSTVTANYHSLIERYLTDVAADSGRVTNVYATDTQYTDSTSTAIQYQQTFGGASTDTTAFPAT